MSQITAIYAMIGNMVSSKLIRIGLCSLALLFLQYVPGNRAYAQERKEQVLPETNRVTVRVDVDEIQIDAVVVDWRGRNVTDMTADEFEIRQDGKVQEITSCRYIRYDQDSANEKEGDYPEVAALPAVPAPILKREDVRRTLVFLVDNLMMNFENVYYARMALGKFVEEQMQPGDMVAILSTSKGYLGPLAFTSDKKQLIESIQNIQNDQFIIPNTRCDTRYQHMLATVRHFNESLRQMPGRKSLIWISGLTRMPPAPAPGEFDDNECRWRLIQAFDGLADEMLHTGVVFHTMDIKGLSVNAPDPSDGAEIALSKKTGGLFLENENFFVDGIGQLNEELKGYYLLTYIPPEGTFASDGSERSHKIDIKSKRWMSEVRYRDQIFSGENELDTAERPQDSLKEAVYSPFRKNDLPVRLSSGYVSDPAKGGLLKSWLHVDGKNLGVQKEANGDQYVAIEILGMISDADGRIWDEGRQVYRLPVREDELLMVRANGIRISVEIPAKKPGAYYVRSAVKDQGSGKHGSAYQYVEVPDLKKTRLTLSDIFILKGPGNTKIVEGVRSALKPYMPGATIWCETEIYNAKIKQRKPPELEYRYVLYRDNKEVLQAGPIMIDTENLSDYRKVKLTNPVTLPRSLGPGTYGLQLEVRDRLAKEKDSVATQWMNFEIASDNENEDIPKEE